MKAATDTIFALSSGRPPAAIAVVRVSGPQAGRALEALIGKIPEPRRAALARLRDPASQEIIDEGLALWFPAPRSETGEDTAELQLHGGRAVIAGVLAALGRIEGCRPAEAGEFTRRAFENGRLDLTRVEGLADLIGAETEAQRRQAFRQMKGLLGERAEAWRTALVEALALIEARIDFPDEGDVPEDLIAPALARAKDLRDEITVALADQGRGERLREGLVIAIAGPPNAGKSSLLNRLARRDAAIVSPFAGTTRDVIEVHLDLDGFPVTLLDTAGIRDSLDPVEQEGVRRARERAGGADLVLWVMDASTGGEIPGDAIAQEFPNNTKWIIWNKVDLVSSLRIKSLRSIIQKIDYPSYFISTLDESGFDEFLPALVNHADKFLGSTEPALVTRDRHRRALAGALAALDRALQERPPIREEVIAEELRVAATALGRLVGRVDVEDILDVIFRDFCIGK
ncbi:MAG TPA: tRNA uridine-5-carboxymethylaminomethyl(34) synthesis GTPase MnmE [Xanthobacteraceae bacterium]|nr:tRNA uridine-5-carboxymethylaminomethyl(34) synthesis GTPase MnmE [Xanthobacteraceae bacterium]